MAPCQAGARESQTLFAHFKEDNGKLAALWRTAKLVHISHSSCSAHCTPCDKVSQSWQACATTTCSPASSQSPCCMRGLPGRAELMPAVLQADIATLYLEFPGGQQVGLPALDVIAAGVLSLGTLERSPSPVKGRAGSAGEQPSSAA